MIAGFERLDREAPPTLDVGRRTGIAEVETGLRRRRRASSRRRAASSATSRRSTTPSAACCATAASTSAPSTAWPSCRSTSSSSTPTTRAALAARAQAVGLPLSAMVKDDERCIRCGLCAVRCPTDAMTMETLHDHGTAGAVRGAAAAEAECAQRRWTRHERRQRTPEHGPARLPAEARHRRRRSWRIAAQAGASLRSLVPNVTYDAPTTVKLGPPEEFPDGLKFLPDERLFVFRTGKTFHAISAVCTHLGCTVRAEALARPEETTVEGQPLRLTHRFLCPCHGSTLHGRRTNVSGPAPKPLAWYRLSRLARRRPARRGPGRRSRPRASA